MAYMYPDGPKALPPELRVMTDRLHFTGNEEADRLLVEDPFALLVGFALDQQVPVQKAFMGPYVLRERLGTLDARGGRRRRPRPDLPRAAGDPSLPGRDGDAGARAGGARARALRRRRGARLDDARDLRGAAREHRRRCPASATMKVKALGSVLFKRFGVELAEPLIPWHPTLGDVDSAAALKGYQASKKAHKAEWS